MAITMIYPIYQTNNDLVQESKNTVSSIVYENSNQAELQITDAFIKQMKPVTNIIARYTIIHIHMYISLIVQLYISDSLSEIALCNDSPLAMHMYLYNLYNPAVNLLYICIIIYVKPSCHITLYPSYHMTVNYPILHVT